MRKENAKIEQRSKKIEAKMEGDLSIRDAVPTKEWQSLRVVDRMLLDPVQLSMSLSCSDYPAVSMSSKECDSTTIAAEASSETVIGVSVSKGTLGLVQTPPKIVLTDWLAYADIPKKDYLQSKFSTYDTYVLQTK